MVADKCLGEEEEEDMVLLDLCCGSGLFGLAMADRVKNVIGNAAKIIKRSFPQILFPTITGVDLSGAAVDDAESNAEASGVENAEFLHAEKLENGLEVRRNMNSMCSKNRRFSLFFVRISLRISVATTPAASQWSSALARRA